MKKTRQEKHEKLRKEQKEKVLLKKKKKKKSKKESTKKKMHMHELIKELFFYLFSFFLFFNWVSQKEY